MSVADPRIVIIGAGQAAAQCMQSLRANGHDGKITVIGDEALLPYQRPPLSKAFLKGEIAEDRLLYKPADWYDQNNISVRTGARAQSLDTEKSVVILDDESAVEYDKLVIATGARPRALTLPGASHPFVYELRNRDQALALRKAMIPKRHVLVVGAGYIGLEAAAVARSMGLSVTVLEMAERVLARVTGPQVSEFFSRFHKGKGVEIRTGVRLQSLDANNEGVTAHLSNGEQIQADFVLSGIGVVPNTEIAESAGIKCDDGIVVDLNTETSISNVFAIGDCARRPIPSHNTNGRLESVHNAIEQGKIAAASIMEKPLPTLDCPWFWSDQFDLKLQSTGLSHGYDATITRGNPDDARFSVWYFRGGKLLAVDAINEPAAFVVSKKLIQKDLTDFFADLPNPAFPLKTLLKAA